MDKAWFYVAGILAGTAVLSYLVITMVFSSNPPAF